MVSTQACISRGGENDKLLFLFEDYALDTDRCELRRDRDVLAVEPQVFDLLVYLIKNRDRVASKDELVASVWGGRAISDSTLTTRLNAARCAIGDSGAEQRLVKTLPRKGVRFIGTVREEPRTSGSNPRGDKSGTPGSELSPPDRPSVAVLPFTNMSGDPEQEYFADGIVEEIITALSRFSSLFVIARNSSFTYKGRSVDVKQVGRELGVRYVLEGSVRKAAHQVRISGQLIDADTGTHLWADRFNGTCEDIFELQDRVTSSVVAAIVPKLEQAEIRRTKYKPTKNLNAYDYFLRGMVSFHQYNKEATSEALHLFRTAIELDPEFAAAYAMAARCYHQRRYNRWMNDPEREASEAIRLARHALQLARDDSVALCFGGWILDSIARDPEAGSIFIDRARTLNPNFASAWLASGWVRIHLGDPEMAIVHLGQAMRLSPLDQFMFHMQTGMAFAHFLADRSAEAASWSERALREKPDWLPALRIATTSSALAGRIENAQAMLARLRQIDPGFRISNVKDFALFVRPQDIARLEQGFRIAGLPD